MMKNASIWLAIMAGAFVLFVFQNCGKVALGQRDQASLDSSEMSSDMMDKQVIVKMKDNTAQAAMATWAQNNGLDNLLADDPQSKALWDSQNMSCWKWSGTKSVSELLIKLRQSSLAADIEYSEPNYMLQTSTPRALANIPLASQIMTQAAQYASEVATLQSSLTPLNGGSTRPIVAVIDSGVDVTHQAFVKTDAIWVNPGESGTDGAGHNKASNGIDDDSNGFIDDVNGYNFKDNNANIADSTGHGTHCAGITLGVSQNIFDLSVDASVTPSQASKVQIMVLKFIGPTGGATSDAINAIFYAANNGAQVMSNSWGGPTFSRSLQDAIAYAYNKNVLFVAAAGNAASNNDTTAVYPANYQLPNVISVAASDNQDRLAAFSNFGIATVDIAAPGVSIQSTYPKGVSDTSSTMYEFLSGTSMATPMVSGLAAAALYENKLLLPHQVKALILAKADPVSVLNNVIATPARINPAATVAEAKVTVPASSKPTLTL
ncbi:MAG: S8 family peptidase, partial [Pseudobdellovibrio sp.]